MHGVSASSWGELTWAGRVLHEGLCSHIPLPGHGVLQVQQIDTCPGRHSRKVSAWEWTLVRPPESKPLPPTAFPGNGLSHTFPERKGPAEGGSFSRGMWPTWGKRKQHTKTDVTRERPQTLANKLLSPRLDGSGDKTNKKEFQTVRSEAYSPGETE